VHRRGRRLKKNRGIIVDSPPETRPPRLSLPFRTHARECKRASRDPEHGWSAVNAREGVNCENGWLSPPPPTAPRPPPTRGGKRKTKKTETKCAPCSAPLPRAGRTQTASEASPCCRRARPVCASERAEEGKAEGVNGGRARKRDGVSSICQSCKAEQSSFRRFCRPPPPPPMEEEPRAKYAACALFHASVSSQGSKTSTLVAARYQRQEERARRRARGAKRLQ